jgi:hypothetical protein
MASLIVRLLRASNKWDRGGSDRINQTNSLHKRPFEADRGVVG